MVIFTERQQRELRALLESHAGLPLDDLASKVEISRRTLYRDIAAMRLALEEQGMVLVRDQKRCRLKGDVEARATLQAQLTNQHRTPSDNKLAPAIRRNLLAFRLLLMTDVQKIMALALDLGVSVGTVTADLAVLDQTFAPYEITIERVKSMGVVVVGDEQRRRELATGVLVSTLNEVNFVTDDPAAPRTTVGRVFARLYGLSQFQQCYQVVREVVQQALPEITDIQLIQTVGALFVTWQRVVADALLRDVSPPKISLKARGLTYQVLAKLRIELPANEVLFLSRYFELERPAWNVYIPTTAQEVNLSRAIMNFITAVGRDYEFDFHRDSEFVNRISHHIMGLMSRQVQLPEVHIATLDKVAARFPQLRASIVRRWRSAFPQFKLGNYECNLVLLHFASAYLDGDKELPLNVLIICENGLGTSQILAQRLRVAVPQVQEITAVGVAGVNTTTLDDYAVILSTVRLPSFPRDYMMVNPLLFDDEVARIQRRLHDYAARYRGRNDSRRQVKNARPLQQEHLAPREALKRMVAIANFTDDLFDHFKLVKLSQPTKTIGTLVNRVSACMPDSVVKDRGQLKEALVRRTRIAPIGIPGSSLALLHTASPVITRPLFWVIELAVPLEMPAMDGEAISVTRLMYMVAPAKVSGWQGHILGSISSLVVVDQEYLRCFMTGTTVEIKELLARRLLTECISLFEPAKL
ncbi:HTH domain-containing protein [Ligilactobacillus sp. LYQ112]|uniref:HTH domain-containing protein n=1 Tax=Ligilactobacillus sp. LYQ112 TaxID=3391060 RepID=UPI003983914F